MTTIIMWFFNIFIWFNCIQIMFAFQTNWNLFTSAFRNSCLCRCGIPNSFRNGRFRGSQSILPHEFPWLAVINGDSLDVAGSLISDRHVITAASPFFGLTADKLIVTLGAHNRCNTYSPGLNVSVESITLHPGFSSSDLDNDVAIVKLKHRIAFSRYISPICLPLFDFPEYEQVTWTAGWAKNESCAPQIAVLPTVSASSCSKESLPTDKGCLGPLGTKSIICKTDIGAPVMSRWSSLSALRIIGIVSSSFCESTTPPIFTRVIEHVGWIYDHIRADCQCV